MVTEFPLLEWNEEENRYTAMHHPFTMLMDEDIPLIESGDLGKIRAKAYDIVLNGNEIRVEEVFESIRMTSRKKCL